MTTDKGGSDLDVFNDLKPQTPDGKPITDTKKTLMGLQAPEGFDGGLPPVPGSSPAPGYSPATAYASASAPDGPSGGGGSGMGGGRSVPPPPPSQRPRRSAGAAPSRPNAAPLSNGDQTPVTPSAGVPGIPRAGLQLEEERAEDTSPGVPPDSLLDSSRLLDSSKVEAGGLSLDAWATTQPQGSRISLPPAQNPSLPAAVTSAAVPSALASAAVPAAAGAASGGDIGWDDDDDKTQIYDKDTQAAAQSLLQPVPAGLSLPGMSGRPPPPMSRPPGAIMPPGYIPPGGGFASRTTVPPTPDASFAMPVQAAPNQRLPYLFAIAAAVIVGALFWFMLPKKGSLTVTVAGAGNRELAAVEVVVDNKLRCRSSPCELPSLKAGTHYVEVRAAGYQPTAKSAVAIVGGQNAVHNVQLIRAGTGIKVFGEGSGLTLLVDGKEFGPLPQELREMEPGEHVIQVSGGPRYEVFQQRIMVDPDRMTPIGPIKLKVLKGLATIRAGENADGAEVMLKVGDSRRILPPLPVRLEVETDRSHVLIARKRGFVTFEEPITFEDGQAERTIEIDMVERPPSGVAPRPRRTAAASPAAAEAEPNGPAEEEVAPDPTGNAMLNLTSTPPSNVLLDGKPLGTTPLRGISVEPGSHRVIFIHGAERKPKTVEAAPGSEQTVSVTF